MLNRGKLQHENSHICEVEPNQYSGDFFSHKDIQGTTQIKIHMQEKRKNFTCQKH